MSHHPQFPTRFLQRVQYPVLAAFFLAGLWHTSAATEFDIERFSNAGEGWFDTFHVDQSEPLQSALESAPGSSDGDGDGEWDDGTRGAIMRDAIASSASEVDLGYQRETGRATFEVTPIKELRLGISFERDERTGTMPQNLGAYFSDPFSEVAALLRLT